MPLHCTACGYPASQPLTCAECGGHEFHSSTTPPDRRWWLLLVAIVIGQGALGLVNTVYSFATYHSAMKGAAAVVRRGGTVTSSSPVSDDPWVNLGKWVQTWRVVDTVCMATLLVVVLLIGLGVCVRRLRTVVTVVAAAMFLAYTVAGIVQQLVNYLDLP